MSSASTSPRVFGRFPAEPARPFLPGQLQAAERSRASKLGYILFLTLTGCFFVRPTEVLGLEGWNLFEILIVACGVVSLRTWVRQVSPRHLLTCPTTGLMLCLTFMIEVSRLTSPDHGVAIVVAFLKCGVYYALLLGMVDSSPRLQSFVIWLALFIFILGLLPVLQYHDWISVSGVQPITDTEWDADIGQSVPILRLAGAGTFHDPNDLCQILSVGLLLSIYSASAGNKRLWKMFWLGVLACEGYAIVLTRSRGGLIALILGSLTLARSRFGTRKTILLGISVLVCFTLFHSRQTELSTTAGTAQTRVDLWAGAFELFVQHPFLGVGAGTIAELLGHVVHNSFIQGFAELGFFGGATLLSLWAVAVWNLLPMSVPDNVDPSLARLRNYLLAALVAYIGGMLSLSHIYELTPCLLLALAAAAHRIASPDEVSRSWITRRFLQNMLVLSAVFLVSCHLFIRFAYQS